MLTKNVSGSPMLKELSAAEKLPRKKVKFAVQYRITSAEQLIIVTYRQIKSLFQTDL